MGLAGLSVSSGGSSGVACLLRGLGVCLTCRHRPYRRHMGIPRPLLLRGLSVYCRGSREGDGVSRSLGNGAGVAHLSFVLGREGGGVLRSLGKGAGVAHTPLLLWSSWFTRGGGGVSRSLGRGAGATQRKLALLWGEGVSRSLGT